MQQKVKKLSEKLWVEKYRPKQLKSLIIPERIRTRFSDGDIGANLLLVGSAGLGKTTLAHILAQGRSALFIDGSTETSIEVVRGKILDFGSTASLKSLSKKVIILDEAEQFSSAAQKALKATIEKFANNVFFIFTSNHPERLDAPLKSRLETINFNFSDTEEVEQKRQYVKRIQMILEREGNFKVDAPALTYILKRVYPDLRQIINLLYQTTRSMKEGSVITIDHVSKNYGGENVELYETIINEHRPEALYKYIKSNHSGKELQCLNSLGNNFLEYLNNTEKWQSKTLPAAVITHKYLYEANTGSINPLLPLLAAANALSDLFK